MKQKILLQIDHAEHASSFDSIVAIDSGVDQLLKYSSVTPIQIESIVHGAMFTRGPDELKHTAIFFGGDNVENSVELFEQAQKSFFGPLRVSLMSDPNGSNTTAAAAVLRAQQHVALSGSKVTVLAGTGPVGQRIAQLAAGAGAEVTLCSRRIQRAHEAAERIGELTGTSIAAVEAAVPAAAAEACRSADIVFAAGAAGVELLDRHWLSATPNAKIAIDINAVPPHGITGVEPTDCGEDRGETICYGAIGVGQLKMKIHKTAIHQLFESNNQILALSEIFEIGKTQVQSES